MSNSYLIWLTFIISLSSYGTILGSSIANSNSSSSKSSKMSKYWLLNPYDNLRLTWWIMGYVSSSFPSSSFYTDSITWISLVLFFLFSYFYFFLLSNSEIILRLVKSSPCTNFSMNTSNVYFSASYTALAGYSDSFNYSLNVS